MVFWFLLPFAPIIGGATVLTLAVAASDDRDRAESLRKQAKEKLRVAQALYTSAAEQARVDFEALGEERVRAVQVELAEFVELSKRWRHARLPQFNPIRATAKFAGPSASPAKIVEQVRELEAVFNAAAAVGVGAGASATLYGTVAMFGVASTGTPIAMLSGAAAQSATLAALGGGSLAAGGLGMAAGAAVLGGAAVLVALPVLGVLDCFEASEELAHAKEQFARVEVDAEKLETATAMLEQLSRIAGQYHATTHMLRELLQQQMRYLRATPTLELMLSRDGHRAIATAYELADTLCQITRQPLVDDEGNLFEGCLELLQAVPC